MNGHCLCGAVTFASTAVHEIGACHCTACRRWGGGPFMAVHCGTDVRFSGGENMTIYASSKWAERAFCKKCGSHLYFKLLATSEYFVPVGAFESNDFKLTSQVYIDRKPEYYSFADETTLLTEQQVLDRFSSCGNLAFSSTKGTGLID